MPGAITSVALLCVYIFEMHFRSVSLVFGTFRYFSSLFAH